MDLRDYQSNAVAKIFEALKETDEVLVVAPTGSGKTEIFTWIASQISAPVLINVHRRELASQACKRLTRENIDFGLIMAGEQAKPYARVQVATIGTLVRKVRKGKKPRAGLVINDEAHLSTADTWEEVSDAYPNVKKLGFTASPYRLSGKPLSGKYGAVVVVAQPAELCALGFLSPYVGFSYKAPDLSGIKTINGDYDKRQSSQAMSQSLIVDNVVEQWLAHSSHLSTVVFAVTIEHSKTLVASFKAAGVTAEHLDGKTSKQERKAILQRVESGETRVLCNVNIAAEGLDIPRLKCCVLARPTKSLALAIQMMGRVRRPWRADGREVSKQYPSEVARIHDHGFVIPQHGLPDDDRDYTLDAPTEIRSEEGVVSITTCPSCLALYRGPFCTACAEPRPVGQRILNTIDDAEKVEFSSGQKSEPKRPDPVKVKWNAVNKEYEGTLGKRWDETSAWGKQRFYELHTEKRDYHLPGTAVLNAKLAAVKAGAKLRIKFTSETNLPGDKTRKEFEVQLWKVDTQHRRSLQQADNQQTREQESASVDPFSEGA